METKYVTSAHKAYKLNQGDFHLEAYKAPSMSLLLAHRLGL